MSSKGKREFARTMQAIFEGKFKRLDNEENPKQPTKPQSPTNKNIRTIYSSEKKFDSQEAIPLARNTCPTKIPDSNRLIKKK